MAEFDAERLEAFLRPARIAVVATISRDGTPQVTPVWYAYEDGRLIVTANDDSAKVRNLKRDSRISVSVHSGERGEEYAALYGRAELEHGDGVWPQVRAIVDRYEKPEDVEEYMKGLMAERFTIITFAPERVLFGP